MYAHMIQQAAAFLHAIEVRYVLSLQILFSLSHPIKLIFLLKMNFLDVVVGSSHNREHLWPNAKTLRTANGYSAEPRGRGIFLLLNFLYSVQFSWLYSTVFTFHTKPSMNIYRI